jgi:hypothetical protein
MTALLKHRINNFSLEIDSFNSLIWPPFKVFFSNLFFNFDVSQQTWKGSCAENKHAHPRDAETRGGFQTSEHSLVELELGLSTTALYFVFWRTLFG